MAGNLDPKAIGARIRSLRESRIIDGKPMVQDDLGSAIGLRGLAISELELAKTANPKTTTIAALAEFFGVTVDFILFGREPEVVERVIEREVPTRLAAFLKGTRVTDDERAHLLDLATRRSDGAIDYADELQSFRVPDHKKVEDRAQAEPPRLPPDARKAAPLKRKASR